MAVGAKGGRVGVGLGKLDSRAGLSPVLASGEAWGMATYGGGGMGVGVAGSGVGLIMVRSGAGAKSSLESWKAGEDEDVGVATSCPGVGDIAEILGPEVRSELATGSTVGCAREMMSSAVVEVTVGMEATMVCPSGDGDEAQPSKGRAPKAAATPRRNLHAEAPFRDTPLPGRQFAGPFPARSASQAMVNTNAATRAGPMGSWRRASGPVSAGDKASRRARNTAR